jgi:hypothetical protein
MDVGRPVTRRFDARRQQQRLIIDAATRAKLVALRREALEAMQT